MVRRLSTEEEALWAKVVATVRPLRRIPTAAAPAPTAGAAASSAQTPAAAATSPPALPSSGRQRREAAHRPAPPPIMPGNLDGGWDRRLAAGRIAPDVTVDLHGHNLASAHALLETRLADALTYGCRVMLVITGRPPRADSHKTSERPRGLIRQQLPDWLAVSPHRHAIAAIRGAHPRHGGAGALYLILRRKRETATIP